MPPLSALMPWLKEHPWVALGFLLGLLLSVAVRAEAWMTNTDTRLGRLESQAAVISGMARVVCLKTDGFTTSAADLPCDALLHRGRP